MSNHCSKSLLFSMVLLLIVVSSVSSGQGPQEQPPDDVSGNWTIYSKNIENGETVTKFVRIV
jgi:hypothetical protein